MPDGQRAEDLERMVLEQAALIESLRARVELLEAELERLRRDSSTTGKPPSADTNEARGVQKQSRALRREAQRKAGKQPGAQGRHLASVAEPDEVVFHRPAVCEGCGGGLDDAEVVSEARRQVFDVPEVRARVVEHVACRVRCVCGCATNAVFPVEATAPACWGPTFEPWPST